VSVRGVIWRSASSYLKVIVQKGMIEYYNNNSWQSVSGLWELALSPFAGFVAPIDTVDSHRSFHAALQV
jgi:hypothetical protein